MIQFDSNFSSLLALYNAKARRNAKPSTDSQAQSSATAETTQNTAGDGGTLMAQFFPARDVANAVSFGQTQGAYLQTLAKALDRMSDLATQAQQSGWTDAQMRQYQQEFAQLSAFIKAVAGKDFNGISIFSSSSPGGSSGGPSMPVVDLSTAAYSQASMSAVGDAASAKEALKAVQAAKAQLAVDQGAVTARVDVLFDVAQGLNQIDQPARAESEAPLEESKWLDSVSTADLFAESERALLAQANVNPDAVSRLLA